MAYLSTEEDERVFAVLHSKNDEELNHFRETCKRAGTPRAMALRMMIVAVQMFRQECVNVLRTLLWLTADGRLARKPVTSSTSRSCRACRPARRR